MLIPSVATLTGLVTYLILAWFLGDVLHLTGRNLWLMRIALGLLGFFAAGAILWYLHGRKKQEAAESAEAAAPDAAEDIEPLVREAEAKLAAAHLGKVGKLPMVFVAGHPGSTKTSTVLHSSLEPELLAGHVYQDTAVVPTRTANLWLAGRILFTEFGGALLGDAAKWTGLVKRLQPSRLKAVMGSSGQAPRATLLCVDIETFTRPGASEQAAAIGRNLRQRLGEMSQTLGISLPVYVLFTRLDRVPFFLEYVRNLTPAEASQVLGVSLPMAAADTSGTYADREAARLNAACDGLFRSLCDNRPEFLARENEASLLPAVYEFPREFRKIQPVLVSFLTDLCRPSQLTVGPFLRGFYFSGVRPIVVNEAAGPMMPQPAEMSAAEPATEATTMFRMGGARPRQAAAAAPMGGSRKVPQWAFLPQFFQNVLLQDRVAMGASGSSTKTSLLRRILLWSAAGVCLLFSIAFLVSYLNNRELETAVRNAAEGIGRSEAAGTDLASLDGLQRLETLRQSLEKLTRFNRNGADWSYRWGLYIGDSLYPAARKLYFDRFGQLLQLQTREGLRADLRALPPAPPGPEYAPTYNKLKAYLITTSHHEKSSRDFLAPVLLARWSGNGNPGPDRTRLAQKQFEFYAEELKYANPYSSDADRFAVDNARRYLAQFADFERVYLAMLTEAGKAGPPINFNRRFPGSAETVINGRDVSGAFTKPGFDFVKNAFNNPERYFKGDEDSRWVLGDPSGFRGDRSSDAMLKLTQQLKERYYADFLGQWRAYMKASAVVRYRDIKDAAQKLNVLSGNQSPLLALFWLASQNTAVDDPALAKAFQPVQAVVPPASVDRYIGPANQTYVTALVSLQASLEGLASQAVPDPAAANQTLSLATAAKVATRQVAQGFSIDPDAHVETTVQHLMEEPITNVEALLRGLGPAELNGKGKGLCSQMRPVWNKYPFNPASHTDATVAEVNSLLRKPDGALWALYDSSLQKLLVRQGNQYVPAPGATVALTPGFVHFFNQAAALSDMLYAGNSQDPHFVYRLKPLPPEGISSATIRLGIDGQTLTYAGGSAAAQQFVWQAAGAHGVTATLKFGGGPDIEWSSAEGLWAVFRFFDKADRWQPLEWVIRSGKDSKPMSVEGRPVAVRFEVDMGGASPVFQKGFFGKLGCVAEISR
jgi:type VI secretion system protein ImpL